MYPGDIPLNDPAPARGATSLETSSEAAASLQVGDYILPVAQFPWGGQGNYSNQMEKFGIGQVVQITAIDGTTIHFDQALGLDFTEWPFRRIRLMNMLKDVGIEGVHIEKLISDDRMTLNFDHVQNAYVKNTRIYYTDKTGIEVRDSSRMFIEGNNISHSFDYGAGGHGYGVRLLNNTAHSFVVNNKFHNLRHAIVMQTGANHNVIAYNSVDFNRTYDNILLHGNYSHNNLFEGNIAGNGILYDKVHGMNGPYNTIYRNLVLGNRAGSGTDGIRTPGSSIIGMVIGNVTTNLEIRDYDFDGMNRVIRDVVTGETIDEVIPGGFDPDIALPNSLFLNG